jgi:hypothetical protein
LEPLIALGSYITLISLKTLVALISLESLITLRTNITLETLRTLIPLCANVSLISLRALIPLWALNLTYVVPASAVPNIEIAIDEVPVTERAGRVCKN